ncbi:D-amino-acid oxidase [Portunus trituberculatus]|uniref:D-amino-acid oxidase n=1 Tax=Portunus trituberculatus TaxID=210409 RepID=A0A5B7CKX6_PORTR|nr:D-amino-acid oxidase [Portunus trituberculatus]
MVRVVVVGGGVNGVGSALAIQRRHPQCQVTVVAKSFTPHTTGGKPAKSNKIEKKGRIEMLVPLKSSKKLAKIKEQMSCKSSHRKMEEPLLHFSRHLTTSVYAILWSRDTFELYGEWYRNGEGKARGVSLVHGTGLASTKQPTPSWHTIPIGYINLSSDQRALYGPQYQ